MIIQRIVAAVNNSNCSYSFLIAFHEFQRFTMRNLIYISGIAGVILIVFRLLGIFMEFPFNDLLLIGAILLLGIVCLPLAIVYKYQQNRKIDSIIQSYKRKTKQTAFKGKNKDGSIPKGWDMNTTPFRERKSGLTWGGGNLYGAKAKRGNRRSLY